MDATEPAEGTFRFTNADAQVSFAQANNIIVRGHTLLWHNQIPAWVFTDPVTGATMQPSEANKALLTQRLQNHIRGVAGHFVGKLYAWDVVNEVIDENQPDCLRRSTWYNILGPQYLDIAFQTAREVDPNAKLFINEFNSAFGSKRACYFNVVRDLKARGVPVDGVDTRCTTTLNSRQCRDSLIPSTCLPRSGSCSTSPRWMSTSTVAAPTRRFRITTKSRLTGTSGWGTTIVTTLRPSKNSRTRSSRSLYGAWRMTTRGSQAPDASTLLSSSTIS